MRRLASLLGVGFGLGVILVACSSSDDGLTETDIKTVCKSGADCSTGLCNTDTGACLPTSAGDGQKNGTETDVDCGGNAAGPCADGKSCLAEGDCRSAVCTGNVCQVPTTSDGVKNGAESDIDCGGAGAPKCADTKKCTTRDDCTSDVCTGNVCTAATDADGVKNGTETDVDCGGPGAKRCDTGKTCAGDGDCLNKICDATTKTCPAPTFDDKVQNGTETDVDCGGTAGKECATGKACLVGTDCTSGGCNDRKICAAGKSCTNPGGAGAYTCGVGGAGGQGDARWEDCCATAPVTTTVGGKQVTVQMDKYQTTAGRMRVFLEDVKYDVRAFVKGARAAGKIPLIPGNATRTVLESDWDLYLPTSFDGTDAAGELSDCDQGNWDYSYDKCCPMVAPTKTTPSVVCPADTTYVDDTYKKCHYWNTANNTCRTGTGVYRGIYTAVSRHLGGTIFKDNAQTASGCFVGAPGTHAFLFPDGKQDGSAPKQPQSVYDTKSMQCIDYLVAQAFCVWDGGRLETLPEWQAAWGPGTYPWSAVDARGPEPQGTNTYFGCRFPNASDADQSNCAAGYTWNASTTTIQFADYQYSYEYPNLDAQGSDYIVFISAPGRTTGRGPAGHADVIGNNFELTSTVSFNGNYATTPSPLNALHRWSGNGSWEVHAFSKSGGGNTMLLNKYGKLGMRCVKP